MWLDVVAACSLIGIVQEEKEALRSAAGVSCVVISSSVPDTWLILSSAQRGSNSRTSLSSRFADVSGRCSSSSSSAF